MGSVIGVVPTNHLKLGFAKPALLLQLTLHDIAHCGPFCRHIARRGQKDAKTVDRWHCTLTRTPVLFSHIVLPASQNCTWK